MAELTRDETRYYHLSDVEEYPLAAGVVVYEGAAVGENGSGYARPLVAGDQFLGFATKKASNSAGVAGDERVQLKTNGLVKLLVAGVTVAANKGADVYASNDGTFTVSAYGNSRIGKVHKVESDSYALVRIDVASKSSETQPLTWATKPTTDSFGRGQAWFHDINAMGYSDGNVWTSLKNKYHPPALTPYDIGRYATGAAAPAGTLKILDIDTATFTETFGTGVTGGKVTTHAKEGTNTYKISLGTTAGQTLQSRAATVGGTVDLTNYDYIELTLFSDEYNLASTSGMTFYLYTNYSADHFSISISQLKTGWNIVRIPKDSFTSTGSPLWNDIKVVRFLCTSIAANTRNMYLAKIQGVITKISRGCVSLGFDDSLLDHHLAAVLAAERGIKLTFFCMPNVIGGEGRLTFSHIDNIMKMGHEIGMHGPDSGNNWSDQITTQGLSAFTAQMIANKAIGVAHGWDTEIGSYPQGIWDPLMLTASDGDINSALRAAGLKYLRGANNYATVTTGVEKQIHAIYSTIYKKSTMYLAGGVNLQTGVDLATAKTHIDNAIAYGAWYNPYSHSLAAAAGSQTWAVQDYIDLLDYMVLKRDSGLVDIRPFGEVARELESNGYVITEYES